MYYILRKCTDIQILRKHNILIIVFLIMRHLISTDIYGIYFSVVKVLLLPLLLLWKLSLAIFTSEISLSTPNKQLLTKRLAFSGPFVKRIAPTRAFKTEEKIVVSPLWCESLSGSFIFQNTNESIFFAFTNAAIAGFEIKNLDT